MPSPARPAGSRRAAGRASGPRGRGGHRRGPRTCGAPIASTSPSAGASPTRTGSHRAAAAPIDAVTDGTSAPMLAASKPVAADRVEGAALLVEQQQVAVAEAEELVEPVERGVDEHVEVGAPPDRASTARPVRRGRRCRGVATSAVPAGRPDGWAGTTVDVDDAEDVGGPEPEDVLHALEGGDGLDVACAAARRRGRDARSARRRAPVGTRRTSPGRAAAGSPAGSSARLRAVLDMNWLDRAMRSASTRWARDRYVTFGIAVGAGGGDAPPGTAPPKQRSMSASSSGSPAAARRRSRRRHRAPGVRARRLVEQLLDRDLDARASGAAASGGSPRGRGRRSRGWPGRSARCAPPPRPRRAALDGSTPTMRPFSCTERSVRTSARGDGDQPRWRGGRRRPGRRR